MKDRNQQVVGVVVTQDAYTIVEKEKVIWADNGLNYISTL